MPNLATDAGTPLEVYVMPKPSFLISHEEAEAKADERKRAMRALADEATAKGRLTHWRWGASAFCDRRLTGKYLVDDEELVTCGRCQERIGRQDVA